MQRFTISLDDHLAHEFDHLISQRGYATRSEAVRDLIRERLGSNLLDAKQAKFCVTTVTYVYDHHEATIVSRLLAIQHQHHDLVVSCLHTHLDHDNCLETVIMRGLTADVQSCAGQLIALRGVRNGQIHSLALSQEKHTHHHTDAGAPKHRHLTPLL